MKYEILDKDTSGVIVTSGGKLYRVEYPSKGIMTIGATTTQIFEYVDWEIGEQIDHMAGIPIDEYIENCNEVDQNMTSDGKITYTYRWRDTTGYNGFVNWGAMVSGYVMNTGIAKRSTFHIDSISGKL